MPRTVRANPADCLALRRGPSDKPHRTNRSDPRKTDHPRGARGLSAKHSRTVRPLLRTVQTSSNRNSKPRRIQMKGKQEHEEHLTNTLPTDRPPPPRGLSAPHGQSRKPLDLEGQLPQIIIGFPKRLKQWIQGFGDLKRVTQGCYSPKILPPNSLNHRESRIL
jgi:hypothetical protein